MSNLFYTGLVRSNIGHALSLKEAVMGRTTEVRRRKLHHHKMFQSYMENFFGIKESYEKDIPIYKGITYTYQRCSGCSVLL
jgi:hypothetical protein